MPTYLPTYDVIIVRETGEETHRHNLPRDVAAREVALLLEHNVLARIERVPAPETFCYCEVGDFRAHYPGRLCY